MASYSVKGHDQMVSSFLQRLREEGNRLKLKHAEFELDKRKNFLTIRFLSPGMNYQESFEFSLSRDLSKQCRFPSVWGV